MSLKLIRFFNLHLRQFGFISPGENTVEIVHLLHDSSSTETTADFQLKQPKTTQGNNAGEQMTANLAIGPMEHRVHTDMATCFARPKLLFNPRAIQRGCNNLLRTPVIIVGDDDVFAHYSLGCSYLGGILPKAHGLLSKAEPVVLVANIQLLTEFAVAGDDRLATSPMRLLTAVLSAILYQFAAKPLHLLGKVVKLFPLGDRIKRHHHRALSPPEDEASAIGFELILLSAFVAQFTVFGSI